MAGPNHLLRNARLAKGIGLRKMAREIGVSVTTLYRWEMGLQDPFLFHKGKLRDYFEKDLQELGLGPGPAFDLRMPSEQARPEGPCFRSALPAISTDVELVGRERDLAATRERVLAGRHTVLVGLPGVGKTALALALETDHQVRSHFSDGILWASLGRKPNMDDLLLSWSKLIVGFSPQKVARLTREKAIVALQEVIGKHRVLLIFDDVWASADAQTLLQIAGPNCVYLATTRSPLIGIQMVGSNFSALNELDDEAGLHLLGLLAPQAVELEPTKARELVRAVGGLPLALTLIGHDLASETYLPRMTEALERLLDANERLNRGEYSLRSAIALSEHALSDPARTAFRRLSIFAPKPGTFSERAALAVAGCGTEELDSIIDLGLLEPFGEGYRMHQTISDYGRSVLSPQEKRRAEERLLAYTLGELGARAGDPVWLEREKQTILMALDAAEHLEKYEEFLRLTLFFTPFLIHQGYLSLAYTYLQRACEVARSSAAPELPRLLVSFGEMHLLRASFQEGMAVCDEGLKLARHLHDHESLCDILATLAWNAHVWGEYEQAETYLQEGLAMATSLDLPKSLWVLFCTQGSQAWARGDYTEAEAAYHRGLRLWGRVDDRVRADVPVYYGFLGVLEGERGHYLQAEAYFQQAILASQLYGFSDVVPSIFARRAMIRMMYDPADELCEALEQAINTAQTLESWVYAVSLHRALAQLELIRGNLDRAEWWARKALEIVEPFQVKNRMGEQYTILAQIACARGRYTHAMTYLEQALPLLRAYGAAEDQAIALLTWGELELARGDLEVCEAAFRELLKVVPADFLALVALGQYGLARLAAARHRKGEARRLGEESLRVLSELKHIRAPEVRAWLDTLDHRFWKTLWSRQKPAPLRK